MGKAAGPLTALLRLLSRRRNMALSRVVACAVSFALAAEGVQLRASPSVDAIASVMQKLPIVAMTDDSGFFSNATQFLEDLKDKAPATSPFKRVMLDPQPAIGFFSCTRDTAVCSTAFASADNGVCTPTD